MPDVDEKTTTGPSFERRIRTVLWILLTGTFLVAASGIVSAWALTDSARDVSSVEHASDVLDGIRAGMVDQETGVRGFILTSREDFLVPYPKGGETARANRELLDETATGIAGLDSLAALDASISSWQAIADEEIALVRSGRIDEARAIVESGVPKARFDEIRENLGAIDASLARTIVERNARQVELERRLAMLGVIVLVAGTAIIIATLRWLRRSVTRPLATLTGAVGAGREEDFEALAGDAAGEVAAIARSADLLRFNKDVERNEAVLVAEQTERARVAADLHDGAVQMLFALQLRLQHLLGRKLVGHDPDDETVTVVRQGIEVLESTQAQLRVLMFDLAPPGLGSKSLAEVLAATVPQVLEPPTRVDLDVPDDVEFSMASQLVICRVVIEAIRNVNRHAAATNVTIRIRQEGADVSVEVIDDGKGFDPLTTVATGHFGLEIMSTIVSSVGGTFALHSAPSEGTGVSFRVPA